MSVVERLAEARILAILRIDDVDTVGVDLAEQLHARGVRAVECTLDRDGAFEAINLIRDRLGDGVLVGAGTVTENEQIDRLASMDVELCVTPHLDPDLLTHALKSGLTMIPGVTTASEVATAFRLGAPAVKLFPAGELGVRYLRTLQGPFGRFPVVPTGGIDVADVADWLAAGATCVGLGSALTSGHDLPSEIEEVLAS